MKDKGFQKQSLKTKTMWMNANEERFGKYGDLFVPKQAPFTALSEKQWKEALKILETQVPQR